MKVLLCTGDSHTQGQGQDTFSDPLNGEWPVKSYDLVNGTGLGFKRLFDTNSYVNLIRHYLYEKTGSVEEQVSVDFLSEVEGEICFGCDGSDMFVFTIAEEQKEASVSIYTDGELYRRVRLFTPAPRWDDWSARDIRVDCSGKKEIKFVVENGRLRFVNARKYSGTHAVINCGIGSCDCKCFADLTLSKLIEDTCPYMFIAEAHTINDWLHGKSVDDYKTHLCEMLSIMTENSEHTILVTVSPILGDQMRTNYDIFNTVDYYENFVQGSREAAAQMNIPVADANAEFKKLLTGLSEKEKSEIMYCDQWHVNSKGHKVYAEKIIGEIDALLQEEFQ